MGQLILNEDTVKRIKKDPETFGIVAATLGISIRTLSDLLPTSPPRLATATVLKILKDRWGITQDSELLTEREFADA